MERNDSFGKSKGNTSKSKNDDEDDDEKGMSKEEKVVFDAKFKELQVYIPALKKVLDTYEQKKDENKDVNSVKQYNRFRSLYALFVSKKRCKLDTLLKCEDFFKKRFKNKLTDSSDGQSSLLVSKKKKDEKKCKSCGKPAATHEAGNSPCYCCCNCSRSKKQRSGEETGSEGSSSASRKQVSSADIPKDTAATGFVKKSNANFEESSTVPNAFSRGTPFNKTTVSQAKDISVIILDDQQESSHVFDGGRNHTREVLPNDAQIFTRRNQVTTQPVPSPCSLKDVNICDKTNFSAQLLNSDTRSDTVETQRKNNSSDLQQKNEGSEVSRIECPKVQKSYEDLRPNSEPLNINVLIDPNKINISDLTKIQIPEGVSEIVKSISQQKAIGNFSSNNFSPNLDRSSSKSVSINETRGALAGNNASVEFAPESSSSPFQDNFDIQPLSSLEKIRSSSNDLHQNSYRSPCDGEAYNELSHHDIHLDKSNRFLQNPPFVDNFQNISLNTPNNLKPSLSNNVYSYENQGSDRLAQGFGINERENLSEPQKNFSNNWSRDRQKSSNIEGSNRANFVKDSFTPVCDKLNKDPRVRPVSNLSSNLPGVQRNDFTSRNNYNHIPSIGGGGHQEFTQYPDTMPTPPSSQYNYPVPPMNYNYYPPMGMNMNFNPPFDKNPTFYPPSNPVSNAVYNINTPTVPQVAVNPINCSNPNNVPLESNWQGASPSSSMEGSVIMEDLMQMSPSSPKPNETPIKTNSVEKETSKSSLRSKLAEGITLVKKLGKSNTDDKSRTERIITALKPGALSDLTTSKETKNSIHVESLKPVPFNERKKQQNDIPPSKHVPKVSERNLDAGNSSRTNLSSTSVKNIPKIPKPPLQQNSSILKRTDSLQSRQNSTGSTDSFNQTFRSSYSTGNTHPATRSESFNETFRSSYHKTVDPSKYENGPLRTDHLNDCRNFNAFPSKQTDPPHRSQFHQSTNRPHNNLGNTNYNWNRESNSSPNYKGRSDDHFKYQNSYRNPPENTRNRHHPSDPRQYRSESTYSSSRDYRSDHDESSYSRDPRRRGSFEKEVSRPLPKSHPSEIKNRSKFGDSSKFSSEVARKSNPDKEEFTSPLGDVARKPQTAVTGRGYGIQNYKIPKKPRPPASVDEPKKGFSSNNKGAANDIEIVSVAPDVNSTPLADDSLNSSKKVDKVNPISSSKLAEEEKRENLKSSAKSEKKSILKSEDKPDKIVAKSSSKGVLHEAPVQSCEQQEKSSNTSEPSSTSVTKSKKKPSEAECKEGLDGEVLIEEPISISISSDELTSSSNTNNNGPSKAKQTFKNNIRRKIKSSAASAENELEGDTTVKKNKPELKARKKTNALRENKPIIISDVDSDSDNQSEETVASKTPKKRVNSKKKVQVHKPLSSDEKEFDSDDSFVLKSKSKTNKRRSLRNIKLSSSNSNSSSCSNHGSCSDSEDNSESVIKEVVEKSSSVKKTVNTMKTSSKTISQKNTSQSVSESKISSSKKIESLDDESNNSVDMDRKKSGGKSRQKTKIVLSSDSSDDEVLAAKVEKIKKNISSSVETTPKPNNKVESKSQEGKSESKESKDESESVSKQLDSSDQISCNTVDSTSDASNSGVAKVPNTSSLLPENPVAGASQLLSQLSDPKAIDQLFLAVMLQNMAKPDASVASQFFERFQVMQKLMSGDNFEKIKSVLESINDKGDSSKVSEDTGNKNDCNIKNSSTENVPDTASTKCPPEAENSSPQMSQKIESSTVVSNSFIEPKPAHSEKKAVPNEEIDAAQLQVTSDASLSEALSTTSSSTAHEAALKLNTSDETDFNNTASVNNESSSVLNSDKSKSWQEDSEIERSVIDPVFPQSTNVNCNSNGKVRRKRGRKCRRKKNSERNVSKNPKQESGNNSHGLSIQSNTVDNILSESDVDVVSVDNIANVVVTSSACADKEHNDSEKSADTSCKRKSYKNELDRLHEDLRESYIADDVVRVTGVRSCRMKTIEEKIRHEKDENDRSGSPFESLQDDVPSLYNLDKDSEWNGKTSKATKTAKHTKRKLSIVDSSDSETNLVPKKAKPVSDSFVGTLEPAVNIKEIKSLEKKKKATNDANSKIVIAEEITAPVKEIIPAVQFFLSDIPEAYALDYYTPKFTRRKFDVNLFKVKFFPPDRSIDTNVCLERKKSQKIFKYGCGRKGSFKTQSSRRSVVMKSSRIAPKNFGKKSRLPKNHQNQKESKDSSTGSTSRYNVPFAKKLKLSLNKLKINFTSSENKLSVIQTPETHSEKSVDPVKCSNDSSSKKIDRKETDQSEVILVDPKVYLKSKDASKINKRSENDVDDFILVLDKKTEEKITPLKNINESGCLNFEQNFMKKSEVNFTDSDYYYKPGTIMDCKLCSYRGKHVSDHYVLYHFEDQVLSSRLSAEEAESAIAESLFLNFSDIPDEFLIRFPSEKETNGTIINKKCLNKLLLKKWLDDYPFRSKPVFKTLLENSVLSCENFKKSIYQSCSDENLKKLLLDIYLARIKTDLFFCRMCDGVFDNSRKFFEHISLHTGEYLYECTPCMLVLPSVSDYAVHEKSAPGPHFLSNCYPLPSESPILFGYVCSECFFVQLIYENLLLHLSVHSKVQPTPHIVRINMSRSYPRVASKNLDEVAVVKRWYDFNKNDIISCKPPNYYSTRCTDEGKKVDELSDSLKDFNLKDESNVTTSHSTVAPNIFTIMSKSTMSVDQKSTFMYCKSNSTLSKGFSFVYIKNTNIITRSFNFTDVLNKLSKKFPQKFLFTELSKLESINFTQAILSEGVGNDPKKSEAHVSLEPGQTESLQLERKQTQNSQLEMNESPVALGSLSDSVKVRLEKHGGKNKLTVLETKLKKLLDEKIDNDSCKVSLNIHSEGQPVSSSVLPESLEPEAPTIHIPDPAPSSTQNLTTDESVTATGDSQKSSEEILSQSSMTISGISKTPEVNPITLEPPESSVSNMKSLPSLISIKPAEKIDNYTYQMKDPAVRKLRVGPVEAMKVNNEVVFNCIVQVSSLKICNYRTRTIANLIKHVNDQHSNVEWNGVCEPCGFTFLHEKKEACSILMACDHLKSIHLTPINATFKTVTLDKPDNENTPSSHTLQGKSTVEVNNVIQRTFPLIVNKFPKSAEASPSDQKTTGSTAPEPAKLRLRPISDLIDNRFVTATSNKDNDSPLEIAEVKSLANETDLNFDAPIENSPGPKYQLINEYDKVYLITSNGPKRVQQWSKKSKQLGSSPLKAATSGNIANSTDLNSEAIEMPTVSEKPSVSDKPTTLENPSSFISGSSPNKSVLGAVTVYCKECLTMHKLNLETSVFKCPKNPRFLLFPNRDLEFKSYSSPQPDRRLKHSVFPLTIVSEGRKNFQCYKKMLGTKSLMKLFKCMGNLCSYTGTSAGSFIRHIQNHEIHLRNLIKRLKATGDPAHRKLSKMRDWNKCAYCGYESQGAIDLQEHIENEHGRSPYQCIYCFYRAFSVYHVAWHQIFAHESFTLNILACSQVSMAKSFSNQVIDFLKPYVCAIDSSCQFQTYAQKPFLHHFNQEHANCKILKCHICGVFSVTPEKLLMHYKFHSYCHFQCLLCLHGSDSLEDMKVHLLNQHFSRPALVVQRDLPTGLQKLKQQEKSWLIKYGLQDKIVVRSLTETKGNVKATPALPSENLEDDPEEISVEDDFYVSWMTKMEERCNAKKVNISTKPEKSLLSSLALEGSTVPNESSDSFRINPKGTLSTNFESLIKELGIIESPSVCEASTSNGLIVEESDFNFPPLVDLDECESPDVDFGSSYFDALMEDQLQTDMILESRLNMLDAKYNAEVTDQLTQFPHNSKDVEELLSGSFDPNSFLKYIPAEDDDRKTDDDNFELTKDCIDALSLSFDEDSTLLNQYEWCESTATSQSSSQFRGDKPDVINCTSTENSQSVNSWQDSLNDSGLSGSALFRCGNEGCPFAAETSNNLKDHVLMCDLSRSSSSLTCVHCKKLFKLASSLVDHLRTHGTLRFFCSLCDVRASVPHRITAHMKSKHRINSTRLHPINPLHTDIDTSVFIVVPKDKQLIGVNKVNPKTGCKISFNTNELEEIPTQKIFMEPMWCALCPYKSMIRTNLLNHLRSHAIGIEPLIKDYFNPMPTSESKELEPLTNHALSARMAEEKAMKEDGISVLTEHLLEDLHCNYLTQFVPPNERNKCHVEDCAYTSIDANQLCYHLTSLHSDVKTYTCPHCPPDLVQPVKLNKIKSHLKFHDELLIKCGYCDFYHYKKCILDRHLVLEHPSLAQKVERIRGAETDYKEDSQDSSPSDQQDTQRSALKPWHCGLCRYRTLSRKDVAVHCYSTHGVLRQYKCVLCPYSDNSLYDFDTHYFEKHPGISKQILCAFDEIVSVHGENEAIVEMLASRDICHFIPEKFRLKNGLHVERSSLSVEDYIKYKSRFRMLAQLGIDDKVGLHGPLGEPDSNGNFVCPRCLEYRTANVEDMKCHMYRELNYKLFKCGHCNLASSQFHDLVIHSEDHMRLGDEPCIQQLEPNPEYDLWIDRMIATQKSLMKSKKDGQGKEDPPVIENKFWKFGVCLRECMPSYQRFCPDLPVKRAFEEVEKESQELAVSSKIYRSKKDSDTSDIDDFIDIILSDSDDECSYNLAPESVPPPSISLSAELSVYGSKLDAYRKSKKLPRIDFTPPDYTVTDETDLVFSKADDSDVSDDAVVIVDSDSDAPVLQAEGSLNTSLSDCSISSEKDLKYPCTVCGKKFALVAALKNHIRSVHLGLKKYKCNYCQINFINITAIKSHMTKIHPNLNEDNYALHEASFTNDFWFEKYNIVPESPLKSKSKKDKIPPVVSDAPKYSCYYCVYKSNDLANILSHWKAVHKDPVFLTNARLKPQTNVPFRHKSNVSGVSSNKIAYSCVLCKHKGTSEELVAHFLKDHPSSELQISPISVLKYECSICQQPFNSLDSIKSHFSQDHFGMNLQYKNIVVPISSCSKTDSEKSASSKCFLDVVKSGNQFAFYSCPVCPYFSDDSRKMHRHLRVHTQLYICSHCNKHFSNNLEAQQHLCDNILMQSKEIKEKRLSKKTWEWLKSNVKVIKKPITDELLTLKYLPIKMNPKKRKHRSKGIPQKSDAKKIKLTHCAKKSTSAVSLSSLSLTKRSPNPPAPAPALHPSTPNNAASCSPPIFPAASTPPNFSASSSPRNVSTLNTASNLSNQAPKLSMPAASPLAFTIRTNQTARKSTDPKTKYQPQPMLLSHYGVHQKPVDLNSVFTSFSIAGTKVIQSVAVMSNIINIQPKLVLKDCRKHQKVDSESD